MNQVKRMCRRFWNKYQHFAPVPAYMIFYMSVFTYVESRSRSHIHLLSSSYDKMIPFCEIFVIPYLLWFFYITISVIYFGLVEKDRSQYYSLITNLSIGMTIFLIISLVWPNGHTLRPAIFPRENIFTDLVRYVYGNDTSTNVFPSIHVYNSVAVHLAIARCPELRRHPRLIHASWILCILIVLSTVFIKQHTIVDVIGALLMNLGAYLLIYQPQPAILRRHSKVHHKQHI
ncbi:MAG: phosphatase PAP2 family protein [Eubacteriales bacterium]|nr:phosphatase PAP2 family protein [Eubacteriales bacterium]